MSTETQFALLRSAPPRPVSASWMLPCGNLPPTASREPEPKRSRSAAGVNKALLYYYFDSKEKLYVAALEMIATRVRDYIAGGFPAGLQSWRTGVAQCAQPF